ncbi:protein CDV3 homolog isoform X2 [Pleurodeles waltl]|uniref:protein CDV3 homolog isoform X2 n=1 Tax=Pleurodeles waltl TaxID=8319 RepID=UPI003709649B
MAEPEERTLDDFFAKRDKKKRKDKSGTGGSGAAGARSNATGASRPQPEGGTPGGRPAGKPVQEDEWKEFEQKEVDYSGLRIQSLQISNEREDEDGDKREEQGGDWEDQGGGTEKATGPWNKTAPAQAPAPVVETPEPVQSGVYRPPGARSGTATKKPQGPPEIYNDSQFPSLQSTAKHVESRKY